MSKASFDRTQTFQNWKIKFSSRPQWNLSLCAMKMEGRMNLSLTRISLIFLINCLEIEWILWKNAGNADVWLEKLTCKLGKLWRMVPNLVGDGQLFCLTELVYEDSANDSCQMRVCFESGWPDHEKWIIDLSFALVRIYCMTEVNPHTGKINRKIASGYQTVVEEVQLNYIEWTEFSS